MLYVFDGTNSPKRLILGPGIGAIEGGDYLSLSITGSSSFGGLTSGSIPFANANGNLTEDNNDLFWDNANKILMVGSNLPKSGFLGSLLHIKANGVIPPGLTQMAFVTGGNMIIPFVTFVANRGTETVPTAIKSGDAIGRVNFTGHYGISYPQSSPARMEGGTDNDWITGSYGSHISIYTTMTGTSTLKETSRFTHDGSLLLTGSLFSNRSIILGNAPTGDSGIGEMFAGALATGTQIRLRTLNGNNATIQFQTDNIPTFANSIGLQVPGQTIGNDLIISTYTGGIWTENTRFKQGGLAVGFPGIGQLFPGVVRVKNVTAINETGGAPTESVGFTRNAVNDGSQWLRIATENAASLLRFDSAGNMQWWTNSDALTGTNSTVTFAIRAQVGNTGQFSPGDLNTWMKNYTITNLASGSATQLLSDIASPYGIIFVECTNDLALAIYTVTAAGQTTQEMADPSNVFSPTAGTGNSNNIYWSVGNARYEIQNTRAGPRTYRIFHFGST